MPTCARFLLCSSLLIALLNGANAAEPQRSKCRYQKLAELPLQYHGGSLGITMGGEINGTPALMLIDTGATGTYLTRFGTDKRGMSRSPTLSTVRGTGGVSRIHNVPVRKFQIGPIKSEGRGIMPAIDEMGVRPDYDAIVGSDFLLQMDMEFSLAEKKIKFFAGENCDKTFLGYWNPDAVEVPLQFEFDHSRPGVEVMLNGVKMKALIDSGATISTVSLAAAARAGVTLDSPGVTKGGEAFGVGLKRSRIYHANFNTFSIGEELISNAGLRIIDDEVKHFDVVLGTDFLRSHRVLFAVNQRKVYLSYIGGPPFHTGKTEAWVEQEAQAGNSYAQFLLAAPALQSGNEAPNPAALELMQKAVASKNPLALRYMAKLRGREGRHADSVALYETMVGQDAYDMTAQLELFIMRLKAGQSEHAKPALATAMGNFRFPPWPAAITEYYLGKINLEDLFKEASREHDVAKRRRCEVYQHAHALQDVLKQTEAAAALAAKAKAECSAAL